MKALNYDITWASEKLNVILVYFKDNGLLLWTVLLLYGTSMDRWDKLQKIILETNKQKLLCIAIN